VALGDIEHVAAKMRALREELGIKISLDDFGTGFSSLSYLKNLPLDQLKIDQSFVRQALENPVDIMMIKTIIQLARNLGLEVIAEGVETERHFEILHAMGCQAYQGYLFGKPVPIEQF
jgi:EAL domain-containing protein (putative c-di-GMP-specific phosphodiesterase class I)